MKNRYLYSFYLSFLLLILVSLPNNPSFAFAYIFAGEANGINVVTHPIGYTGAGGVLNVSVGIDPTSVNATDMEISVENVVNTFNSLTPVSGNLIFAAANDIPAGSVDFESTLLHELGHSLGLAHVNAATESGLPVADRNYTKATDGVDNTFNINNGTDNVIGSEDDVRGDDIPLNYFRTSNNDPFTIAGTVDNTTYSRDLADLPTGDLYSTNADRDVGAFLGYSNSEAVMQQGAFFDEDQRALAHDDVAGIRYAAAGLDEVAGTSDDYTLVLTYVGQDASANILIDFDDTQTGFAVSQSGGSFLSASHVVVTTNNIYFNTGFSWHFSTTLNTLPVEWAHVSASPTGSHVEINWATSLEVDLDYYEVERSVDKNAWTPLADYKPAPNSQNGGSYSHIDYNAESFGNTLYYRIRQVDIDGKFTHSDIKEVKFKRDAAEVITFGPIPVRPFSMVALHLMQTEPIKLTIRDMGGKAVKSWVEFRHAGYHELRVGTPILQLAKGAYILEVSSPSLRQSYKFTR